MSKERIPISSILFSLTKSDLLLRHSYRTKYKRAFLATKCSAAKINVLGSNHRSTTYVGYMIACIKCEMKPVYRPVIDLVSS